MKSSSRRSAVRRALTGAAVLATLCGLYLTVQWLRGLWAGDPIPTYVVQEQRFVRKVTAEGNLRAVTATPLVAPPRSGGPVKIAWLAADGSRVEEGAVVARFDPTEMEKQLADGEAAVATANRKIAKERIAVNAALSNRDRESALSRLELEQTKKFQRKDAVIFSRNDIIESEIDGALSEAKLSHAQKSKKIEGSRAKSQLDLLAIEKRAAALQVSQAKEGLEGLVLTAPHAGVVVLQRDWRGEEKRVGDQVWPGQAIIEIPHTESMEAEVFVLEADAGGLKEGLVAEVQIEAHPETGHAATVKRVDKLAKPRIRNVPVQYFGVTLELEKTEVDTMKPGQRVRATLTIDERDALVVPRPAVFERDGQKIVYKKRQDGGFESVVVVVGPSSLGRMVIESGLAAGDEIALRDPTVAEDETGTDDDEKGDEAGGKRPSTASMGGR